jgi:hypothetical protein
MPLKLTTGDILSQKCFVQAIFTKRFLGLSIGAFSKAKKSNL